MKRSKFNRSLLIFLSMTIPMQAFSDSKSGATAVVEPGVVVIQRGSTTEFTVKRIFADGTAEIARTGYFFDGWYDKQFVEKKIVPLKSLAVEVPAHSEFKAGDTVKTPDNQALTIEKVYSDGTARLNGSASTILLGKLTRTVAKGTLSAVLAGAFLTAFTGESKAAAACGDGSIACPQIHQGNAGKSGVSSLIAQDSAGAAQSELSSVALE